MKPQNIIESRTVADKYASTRSVFWTYPSATLKLSLDLRLKILMMSFASKTIFHCSLLFLSLFTIICQTFAKPSQDVANSTSVPKQTQHCNNVYFYEAPNKEIAKLLQKITKQLTQVQNDVNILKGNKTSSKGKALTSVIFLVLTNRLQIFISCWHKTRGDFEAI